MGAVKAGCSEHAAMPDLEIASLESEAIDKNGKNRQLHFDHQYLKFEIRGAQEQKILIFHRVY